ncbi:MAG: hypothetical protein ACFFDY_08920 [Candidatus Thorarchaeota archaeon]
MTTFDFDFETQKIFNKNFSNIQKTDWRKWLDISSREEYEELSLKLSGLSSVDDIFKRIKSEITESRSFSIDLEDYLNKYQDNNSLIFCHTSGTTNSNLSMLKWFHMAKDLVKRQWAPGMQAIFESSGLDSKSSVIIFVPSRLKFDGIRTYEEKKYVSLYSSEFSQRIMLSVVKPKSYLFYEYRNSRNLDIISKILEIDNISVISAPALTILGWADITRLQEGIEKSLNLINRNQNPKLEELLSKIEKRGLVSVSNEIQKELSEKISKATLVFSISSLSKSDWDLIRKFMKWEEGNEKFTNLYVASEIGPFAASITMGDYELSRSNRMYIFPLTLPMIEYKGNKEAVSRAKSKFGKLYVSRLHTEGVLINIDLGDVISIKNKEGLPQIDGKILRSSFQLKYPINLSKKVAIKEPYQVLAGDYFEFSNFEIYNPRFLLNCLKRKCELNIDSLLLIGKNKGSEKLWSLFLYSDVKSNCSSFNNYSKILFECIENKTLKNALLNNEIKIKLINENPVDFLAKRSEILEKVRNGKNPKGILKKWPLYIVDK